MTLRRVIVQADRLDSEVEVLRQMRDTPIGDVDLSTHVELMLAQAKRVRRQSTLLVRDLGALRDETLQTEEVTS